MVSKYTNAHREYYQRNKEKCMEYQKEWRKQNPNYRKESYQRNKDHIKAYERMKNKRDRVKVNARQRLLHSLHLYPLEQECEFCDSNKNLQHHHPDYDYPTIYVTTCSSCHPFIDKSCECYEGCHIDL